MEQELDLYAIWQVIKKRLKIIILIPLIAGLVSLLYTSYMITPLYSASTKLMVMRPTDVREIYWQDIQTSRQLVETYREIALSRRVMSLAVEMGDLPYDADGLRGMINVEGVRDTELINLTATDPDPELARDMANVVAAAFMEEVIEIMNIENVSVVDDAVTPGGPVSPRLNFNVAVAFLVGLMGALGVAFLLEFLDQTIKDPIEAQKLLELPVIGVVPQVKGSTLFALSDPRSPPAEAFRTLRTNIQYSSVDLPIKKILVTGANPQCGKSTVAANLSVTLALSGPVLLVDSDLRRPTQHQIFSIDNEQGLSSLIFRKELELENVAHKSNHEYLTILTSGPIPPYPAEMLSSKRMRELVDSFMDRFEYVVFDSPPVIAVTDAALLANLTDGTLLVLDYGQVTRNEAIEALESLNKVQANIIGTIINAMPYSKSYYTGYSYYGSDRQESDKHRKSSE